MIKFIYFDVANTLLRKADLVETIYNVVSKKAPGLSVEKLRGIHHNLVHSIQFPDHTTLEFYIDFNRRLLSALDIVDDQMAHEIFHLVKSLSWQPFKDAPALIELNQIYPFGIISNWGDDLEKVLSSHFSQLVFSPILISSQVGYQKPSPEIFHLASTKSGYSFEEMVFIGDSLTLDYLPAKKLGIKSILIDRDESHSYEKDVLRIKSFKEIKDLLKPQA